MRKYREDEIIQLTPLYEYEQPQNRSHRLQAPKMTSHSSTQASSSRDIYDARATSYDDSFHPLYAASYISWACPKPGASLPPLLRTLKKKDDSLTCQPHNRPVHPRPSMRHRPGGHTGQESRRIYRIRHGDRCESWHDGCG